MRCGWCCLWQLQPFLLLLNSLTLCCFGIEFMSKPTNNCSQCLENCLSYMSHIAEIEWNRINVVRIYISERNTTQQWHCRLLIWETLRRKRDDGIQWSDRLFFASSPKNSRYFIQSESSWLAMYAACMRLHQLLAWRTSINSLPPKTLFLNKLGLENRYRN